MSEEGKSWVVDPADNLSAGTMRSAAGTKMTEEDMALTSREPAADREGSSSEEHQEAGQSTSRGACQAVGQAEEAHHMLVSEEGHHEHQIQR